LIERCPSWIWKEKVATKGNTEGEDHMKRGKEEIVYSDKQ
jgi:hypothetical protein